MRVHRKQVIGAVGALALAAGVVSTASTSAQAAPSIGAPVVINEVYGGGGNSGATYNRDFVELANVSAAPVDLTAWSVQYASSTGTSWTTKTNLSGSIPAGGRLVVGGAGGTTGARCHRRRLGNHQPQRRLGQGRAGQEPDRAAGHHLHNPAPTCRRSSTSWATAPPTTGPVRVPTPAPSNSASVSPQQRPTPTPPTTRPTSPQTAPTPAPAGRPVCPRPVSR